MRKKSTEPSKVDQHRAILLVLKEITSTLGRIERTLTAPRGESPYVPSRYAGLVVVEYVTQKALLVSMSDGSKAWIPKSCIVPVAGSVKWVIGCSGFLHVTPGFYPKPICEVRSHEII